jgi:hypothetical protein
MTRQQARVLAAVLRLGLTLHRLSMQAVGFSQL